MTAAATDLARPSGLRRVLPAGSMLLFTLVGTVLPLVRTPSFYYWDDTAVAAAGVWQRIARSLLSGELPFLQLDMWRGGNLAAEAATGMWNPLMVGLMVLTYPIDDLAVAFAVAKVILFLLMAAGVYLLARSYAANPWLAAVAGTSYTLSGWVLFLDGTAWVNGTAATAILPWSWWAIRRAFQREFRPGSIVLAVVLGYLSASTGNPYAALGLALVYASMAVEAIIARKGAALAWLVGMGFATLLLFVVAYLPFIYTSSSGARSASGLWNDEFLAVSLSDLLGMSSPTHEPYVTIFGERPMVMPGTYLAWYVLPLLPWLRWRILRERWRELSSVLSFGAIYLLLVLGPSQIWLFRWPARLLPFLYLAVIVVFASLASAGLHTDKRRARFVLTAVAVFLGAWLAFSDNPGPWKWHGLAAVLILAAAAVIGRWGLGRVRGVMVLFLGSLAFLGMQLVLHPLNSNTTDYRPPTSKSAMQERFADRDGVTVQILSTGWLLSKYPAAQAWQDVLTGNLPSLAGMNSTTAYSGIGFTKLDKELCSTFTGDSCPDLWTALWRVPKGADRPLADLLRAEHVVVVNGFVPQSKAPAGWVEESRSEVATVYRRVGAIPNPDGTISAWGTGVQVTADTRVGSVGEVGTVSTAPGQTRITFARVAWPGYTLTVDGKRVRTTAGPAGLLTAKLPAGLTNAHIELNFRPPGLRLGLALAATGVLLLIGLVVLSALSRRRSQKAASARGEVEPAVQSE